MEIWFLLGLAGLQLILLLLLLFRRQNRESLEFKTRLEAQAQYLETLGRRLEEAGRRLEETTRQELKETRADQGKAHIELLRTLQQGVGALGEQVTKTLTHNTEQLGKRVETLTQATDQRLREISGQVEKRLTEGFEKTTATFADILKRLALIDEAQKKITELSSNVVSLQEVLSDKRSRGAFGEVQLAGLVRNMLPENAFALQYPLTDKVKPDCILFLPSPTGNVCIDAKFPLENYQRMLDDGMAQSDRDTARRQFRLDVRKHIRDIATKYIIPGSTANGAVMFVPAEAVFAEIHAHHPELVAEAQTANVWMTSPTTLMAVLTTVRAVLKDDATRTQVHLIQQHLVELNKDFGRFQKRMEALASHIRQAHDDVTEVNISARKISERFEKIERVEIEDASAAPVLRVTDESSKLVNE